MKLTRQTTSDCGNHLRGRTHYFIIENATPAELAAMDDLMVEAGHQHDRCPCYADGWGCGYWVDISDVAAFKEAYKSAKRHVAVRVRTNMAAKQGRTLDAMTEAQTDVVVAVAMKIRRELRDGSERLGALRAIDVECRVDHYNPYVTPRHPLTSTMWNLIRECLMVGTIDEVCGWLSALIRNAEAATERRTTATSDGERLQLTFRLSCPTTQKRTVEAAHAQAVEWNDDYNAILPLVASNPGLWSESGDHLRRLALGWAHDEALSINRTQLE